MLRTVILLLISLRLSESLISGKSRVCVKSDSSIYDKNGCKNRIHSDVLLTYQGVSDSSNRLPKNSVDSIITLKGGDVELVYDLDYHMDVPFYYVEKNVDYRWDGEGDHCYSSCEEAVIEECSGIGDIPKSRVDTFPLGVCCQCGKNAHASSQRAKFSCGIESEAFQSNVCMSKSCLKAVNPWYSVSTVSYPPRYIRNIEVTIEDLNGSKDAFKCTINDQNKTCKDEVRDITIALRWSKSQDGQEAHLINKYIFIPSFPEDDPKVLSSSIKNKCGLTDEEAKDTRLLGEACLKHAVNVEKDAVDINGTSCNKIGVAPSHWGREERLCNAPKNTCVNNQLAWYLKEYPEKSNLPKVYGSSPSAHFGTLVEDDEGDEMIRAISYKVSKPHTSSVLVDTPDGSFIEIKQLSGAVISFAKFIECNDINQCFADVGIINNEKVSSKVYINVKCTIKDQDAIFAESEQMSVQLEGGGVKTTRVMINVNNYKNTKGVCHANILSSESKVIDTLDFDVSVKIPEKNIGPDAKSFDSHVIPKVEVEEDKVYDKRGCNCPWYNPFCYLINFSACIWSGFNGIYSVIVAICGIIVLLLIIPIIIAVIKRFGCRCR